MDFFPDFIRALPSPESEIVTDAWMLQAAGGIAMFYEAPDGTIEVAEHSHGAQWGVVLDGTMELEIDGTTTTYGRGDAYFVPAGAPHRATIHPGYVGIDVFADADRYRARADESQKSV